MAFRCLTLTQPYATLVALGEKRIETRDWPAPRSMIGAPLAIHAAKGFPGWAREACRPADPFAPADGDDPIPAALWRHGIADPAALPLGAIVATCRLVDCVRIPSGTPIHLVPDRERVFGDFAAGRFAWFLADVVALPEPIPARGMLGLWTPPADLAAALEGATS